MFGYPKFLIKKKISQILWLVMLLWPILSYRIWKIREKTGYILKIRGSEWAYFLRILNTLIHKKNQPNPVVSYVVMANYVRWNMENPGKNGFILKIRESEWSQFFMYSKYIITQKNQSNCVDSYAVMANFVK